MGCVLQNLLLAIHLVALQEQRKNTQIDEQLEGASDEMICEITFKYFAMKDLSGFITKRKKAKIICFVQFNIESDEDNYFREQLMLFLPRQNEQEELIDIYASH